MPIPLNQQLYDNVKEKIMKSYKKNSAFASGAIVKEYKRQGGKYKDDKQPRHLTRWFEEKWVDVNPILGITKDSAYPVFRPTNKVDGRTPTLLQEIPKERLKEQYKLKQKYKGEKNLPTFIHHSVKKGGRISVGNLKNLLTASYDNKQKQVGDYVLDSSVSSKTSKVYVNPNTGQAVVAHRGTSGFTDWLNNAVYAYGGKDMYKYTPRYREAEKIQSKAQEKYGKDNISTIGHSQGGLQAELLGKNSKEIITLNKATRPFENTKHDNQYDIRTESDIVSRLNPFQGKSKNDILIPSRSKSLLTEHGIDTLGRLDSDREVGAGLPPFLKIGGMVVRSFPDRSENYN
jgi:hypothetical protein